MEMSSPRAQATLAAEGSWANQSTFALLRRECELTGKVRGAETGPMVLL